ncbi:hypothetical protein POM88_010546 [Heracleum sosnowskyi]|uniref:Uncharacterized protein n=1 Tax=Heracleum sosnowskyi TaxID=360622 RepID=A0AAD8ITC5_9APIA|nr:hypothetical protein POM88_010546 [Heracleum sosnowskyi]
MLKELRELNLSKCINLKSSSLKQSFLQVGQHKLNSFEAYIPNKEVAEWLSYKSSGNTLSFTIPPNWGDNIVGFGLWIVYKCKYIDRGIYLLRAVITNRTILRVIETYHDLWLNPVVGETQSKVQFFNKEEISMKSGDRIKVSIPSLLYSDSTCQVPIVGVKVKNWGAHVIQRKPR